MTRYTGCSTIAQVEQWAAGIVNSVERLRALRHELRSRVHDALEDAAPEVAASAIGVMTQVGALVEIATELLAEQVGRDLSARIIADLARHPRQITAEVG